MVRIWPQIFLGLYLACIMNAHAWLWAPRCRLTLLSCWRIFMIFPIRKRIVGTKKRQGSLSHCLSRRRVTGVRPCAPGALH